MSVGAAVKIASNTPRICLSTPLLANISDGMSRNSAIKSIIVNHRESKPYRLTDADSLYLFVTLKGSRLWRFDFRHNGKRNTISFGKWPAVSLKMARDRRDEAHRCLALGDSPAPRRGISLPDARHFETVARDWYDASKAAWTPRYAELILARLEGDIFPHLGRDDIGQIEPPRVLEVIRKIEARGAIVMAKRVKGYCSEVFQFGIAQGKCSRDPTSDIHRALQKSRPKRHRRALPPSEFSGLLAKLETYDGDAITKIALRFTLLTMVRTQEARFAKWTEFEGLESDMPVWRISSVRMKRSRDHLVPLSRQVLDVLKQIKMLSSNSPYLFAKNARQGVISQNTMLFALYRMGYHGLQTTHGFRRCASTILNESGLFEPDWIETQLAHIDRDKIRRAYNPATYLRDRARMMQWWADFIDREVESNRSPATPG